MRKAIILGMLGGLLFSVAAHADMKLATWNMEHLAENNGMGCRAREEADYAKLKAIAEKLNADVVAIEEVESTAAAYRVFDPAKYTVEMTKQPKAKGYRCSSGNPQSPKSTPQHVGFAIKKGIAYSRNADFKALDVTGANGLRWGVDITLNGSNPLRLLAVHLKASCPGGKSDSARHDCVTFFRQQPVLEGEWIEKRYSEGIAFAVLGDFNRHVLEPDDAFWSLTNDETSPGLKLTPVKALDERRCKTYPKRIDHIIVDARAKRRVRMNTTSVLEYGVPKKQYPSDHCPLSVILTDG